MNLMDFFGYHFARFCAWAMRIEHRIGLATGMGPHYLHALRVSILRAEADVHRYQIRRMNHAG